MFRVLWVLTLVSILPALGCGGGASNTKPKEPPRSDKERTMEALDEYHRQAVVDHPHFGRDALERAEQQLKRTPNAPANELFELQSTIALNRLNLGDNRSAAKAYTRAMELMPQIGATPAQQRKMLLNVAVAWLRVAETENCLRCRDCSSCIFPISASAVHTKTEGSEKAIQYLKRLLDQEPENLVAMWLLNIAHMTLGHDLKSIPEAWRLPSDALQTAVEFPQFVNVATDAKVDYVSLAGGVVADDLDGDEWIDLLVSDWNSDGQLRFYHNNRDGTFSDRTEQAGLKGFHAGLNLVQADYDNDGDLDVLVLRGAWREKVDKHVPNSLLRNDGQGRFSEVLHQAGLGKAHFATQTATWLDFDLDGDLDLYIGNEKAPCQLFENDGQGRFQDIAEAAGVTNGGWTKGVASGDFDADGDPDLYVSNLTESNRLYRNNGDGTFTDRASALGVAGPKIGFPTWFWDYNNDGAMDIFAASYDGQVADIAASYFFPKRPTKVQLDHLYEGDGKGGFREVGREKGLTRPTLPMGANFGDLDNDGFLDFYLGTGNWEFYGLMPNLMFRNDRGKRFTDVTTAGGFGHLQKGHGVAFADFDNDGDQDVFAELGGAYAGDVFQNALFRNPGFDNHWIKIKLKGVQSNRFGFGCRIRLTIGTADKKRNIFRWVGNGSSFGANPVRQEIGLGDATKVNEIEVYWPVSKKRQTFRDVAADQVIELTEGESEVKTVDLPK